ncbi:MAG: hypothetical protein ACYC4J_05685 [Gemmatimonadaceae bacterium]
MIRDDLDLVGALLQAMVWRDASRIRTLVGSPAAGRLPREVREEALSLATEAPASLRAPMQTLLYERRLFELLREEEARLKRAG